MKYLKQSTVVRTFMRRGRGWGGCASKGKYTLWSEDGRPGPRIFGRFDKDGFGQLELYEARILSHSNVHLVSYWGPFRSIRELETELATIEELYERYCGTRFESRTTEHTVACEDEGENEDKDEYDEYRDEDD